MYFEYEVIKWESRIYAEAEIKSFQEMLNQKAKNGCELIGLTFHGREASGLEE